MGLDHSGGGDSIAVVFRCVGVHGFYDEAQWKCFAAFAFVAGYGGVHTLSTVGAWRLAAHG